MSRYLFFFLIISMFAAGNGLSAEETLTWSDCIKLAIENHPDLQSSAQKAAQAKAGTGVARSTLLPQVDANAAVSRSKTDTANARSGSTTDSYSYGITGKQLLFDGAKSLYDVKTAQKQLEAADYDYKITSATVRYNLRTSFVQLSRAQEMLSLAKEISAIRKRNFELVQMRYKAGVENKGSLLTAEANLAQSNFEVSQSERNIFIAQNSLIKQLGLKEFKAFKIKNYFTSTTEKEKPDISILVNNNPSVLKISAQRASAEYALKSAKMDNSPKIYGQVSAERNGAEWPPENTQLSAGVTMSLNLFQGGKSYYQTADADAYYKQLAADEKSTRSSVLLTLEQKWSNLQNYTEQVNVQSKFLKAANERAQIADAQYSIGSIVFDNWIIIQDALVNAKKNYLETEINAMSADAEWIQAKGGTLIYGD